MGANQARAILSAIVILIAGVFHNAYGFQIAPLSSEWEEKLTKEPTSNRARVAGKLGRLIKGPVHEEITQLAYDCANDGELVDDKNCASADVPFANAFVIAGIRWNDLPPFRLAAGEAAACKKLLSSSPACNTDQTVRFSTQPECWYCLFKAASATARAAATF